MNLRKFFAFEFAIASIGLLIVTVYFAYHEIAKYTGWESIKYDFSDINLIPIIILFLCMTVAFGVIAKILFKKTRR